MGKVSVIGGGFSGLAAACFAAREGHDVTLFEKNSQIGGRARTFREGGFLFDMGPSWYWMPDIIEKFFSQFNKSPEDYYNLIQLDPGFQVFFNNGSPITIPVKTNELLEMFENIEKGSAGKLKKFLEEAEFKYKLGMQQLVYQPALSWTEYLNMDVMLGMAKSHLFKSVKSYVRSYFKDERLCAIMEFPVLFLGAMPNQIPALYTLMNHAALSQGTFYPIGGMGKLVEAMQSLALSLGVDIKTSEVIDKIQVQNSRVYSILSSQKTYMTEALIASADYQFVEQKLLNASYRNYTDTYWDKKVLAPSCLIFYIGVKKKIKKLIHHNLFFDADFDKHSVEIYKTPQWPSYPLFYVCCPSKTDDAVAPAGMENLFILVPIASGLNDSEEQREAYFKDLIHRIEKQCDDKFYEDIIYKKSYCLKDFTKDYNSFKGNAYGLANTLKQTAVFKPSIKNKRVKNLFYTGQLTIPGPGVPPALISGEIAAGQLRNYFKSYQYERIV